MNERIVILESENAELRSRLSLSLQANRIALETIMEMAPLLEKLKDDIVQNVILEATKALEGLKNITA